MAARRCAWGKATSSPSPPACRVRGKCSNQSANTTGSDETTARRVAVGLGRLPIGAGIAEGHLPGGLARTKRRGHRGNCELSPAAGLRGALGRAIGVRAVLMAGPPRAGFDERHDLYAPTHGPADRIGRCEM